MNIYTKVNAVMAAVKGVEKASENKHARYKFAGHEAVTEALRGAYVKTGIVRHASVLTFERDNDGTVTLMVRVSFVNIDDAADRIDLDIPAIQPSQTSAKTVTAQQVGQAISYAVKNAEFKLFALTGDPEADSDSLPVETPTTPAPSPVAQDTSAFIRARELLDLFGTCRLNGDVVMLCADIKAEWHTLRAVPGMAEHVKKARDGAYARIAAEGLKP